MATSSLKSHVMSESTIPRKDGWYTVTPQMATDWDDTNHNPRNTSLSTVNQYARDMTNNNWEPNGEPIMFDEDGRLLNGFHRLAACRVAEVPFYTYVITGLPRGTKLFDLGYKRTHGQILKITGEHYGNYLAATTRLLWKYERGPRTLLNNRERPTLHDVYELLDRHPELKTSVELCAGSFRKTRQLTRTASIPSIIHYLGSKKHGERATDFLEMIHRGVGPETKRNRAAYMLRERLLDWQQKRVRASIADYLAIWIPAWNAFAMERPIRTLVPIDWSGDAPGSRIE